MLEWTSVIDGWSFAKAIYSFVT